VARLFARPAFAKFTRHHGNLKVMPLGEPFDLLLILIRVDAAGGPQQGAAWGKEGQ
jgi:hypothetical protein